MPLPPRSWPGAACMSLPWTGACQTQSLSVSDTIGEGRSFDYESTRTPADYLDYAKREGSAQETMSCRLAATVGFAGSKGQATISHAKANIGQATVSREAGT